MERRMMACFGCGCIPERSLYDAYREFVDDMMEARSIHLLRYEDFVGGTIPSEALRAMLAGSRDVGQVLRRVHRSGSSGAWRRFLTEGDLATMQRPLSRFCAASTIPWSAERRPRTYRQRPAAFTWSG
jgi:hypothetical protein